MTSDERKFIIAILIIGLVIIGMVLILKNTRDNSSKNNMNVTEQAENVAEYVQNMPDGSKVNVSDTLRKTKTLDGLEITNIQFKENGGITTLLADVENKSGKATSDKMIKIEVLDKSGKTITTLSGIIDAMPAGGKVQLNLAVTADVSNAYDFRISNK